MGFCFGRIAQRLVLYYRIVAELSTAFLKKVQKAADTRILVILPALPVSEICIEQYGNDARHAEEAGDERAQEGDLHLDGHELDEPEQDGADDAVVY